MKCENCTIKLNERCIIITHCRQCPNFHEGVLPYSMCGKYNQPINDPTSIPDYCKLKKLEDVINERCNCGNERNCRCQE